MSASRASSSPGSFSPAPVHVRTARLVGVAVARRAGVAEELLDEVRLAIGEACTRAVALHRQYGLPDLVTVEMSDAESYAVRVIDHAPIDASIGLAKLPPDELADESLTDEALTTGVGFALLALLALRRSETEAACRARIASSGHLNRTSQPATAGEAV